jgi:hypothetical protein
VPDRGHVLPKKFTEGKEPFGEKSQSSHEPAKGLLFPNELLDDGSADEIYKRSHGSYGVGEQIKRGYKWNVDPTTNRFGIKGDTIALNGVSTNITNVLQGDLRNNTDSIVNMKEVEEFRNMKDVLGQSKNLGQGSAMRSSDMVSSLTNIFFSEHFFINSCSPGAFFNTFAKAFPEPCLTSSPTLCLFRGPLSRLL